MVAVREDSYVTIRNFPTLDELVNEILELRPISGVATQIIAMTDNDRFSAHELATAISAEPSLSAKILRLSNSAYYGFPRRIGTVRDAVVLLGFRAVRSATLAQCVIDALPPGRNLDYERCWNHSVAVGILSEILGHAERVHKDEAFTAGVLHNIGRVALDQQLPEALARAIELAERHGINILEAEQDVLGFHDAELGGALALHWSFPEPLATAVAKHHTSPDELSADESLASIVSRARLFAASYGLSDGIDRTEDLDFPSDWMVPPVSVALHRAGGMDGVLERASAFIEHTIDP